MRASHQPTRRAALAVVVFAAVATLGAAPAAQDAVTLAYKFGMGTPLSYKTTGNNVQNVDAMGQTMTTEVTSSMDITLTPKGLKDGNHLLGLKIDAMSITMNGPQGGMTPDVSGIVGKGFDMVVSPLGETIDVSGASALTIDMGQGGRRDMTSDFQGLFDILPDHPVKPGDKWPSQKKVTQKSDAGDVNIALDLDNTLEGFEAVDGRSCARVKTVIKGTMSGALNQQGMDLGLDAKMTGTLTWYFAVKEGLFVKSDSVTDVGGSISVEAAGMTLGFSGQQKSAMALVKK